MTLSIIQWRVPFDDEDCLDYLLIEEDFDHIQNIKDQVKQENGTEDEAEDDDSPVIYVINELTFSDGRIVEGPDKKKYRIRFEEVV